MRKFLCVVLALIIICTYITVVYAENNTKTNTTNTSNEANTTDSNITDLQTQQKDLQDQIQQSHEELEQVQSQLSENLLQIEQLDEKIRTSENEIEKLNEQVETLQEEIANIQAQLDVAQKNYDKQKEIMETRLVAIYEAGNTKYLEVLLNSSNISEFLSNYYLISEMTRVDKELLNDIETEKKQIEDSKQELEENKKTLAEALKKQTKEGTILQNTKALRQNYIAKLSDEEKAKQAKIDEMTEQYESVNNQILELAVQGLDSVYIGGELAWPVPGYNKITSNYGMRVHPITGQYKLHTGVDIGAPMGAEFVAANDGIVIKAEYNTAYGNMVILDHGGGISTLYAHGTDILVTVGQTVKKNEPILKVGSTGYSTGPHAHFEVRINGVVTDPLPYITTGLVPGTETEEDLQEETDKTVQY